ncbi:MAG: PotD/PotF family extracellular solute-binding protein [Gaiellaceae bacterium]
MSERKVWQLVIAVACLVGALALAACGSDDVGGGDNEDVQVAKSGPVEGKLTISNWPGYIDPGSDGTVAEFEKKTGVEVDYIDDITSNTTFFGKLQPQLDQGDSGGRDIFVVTDWMAKRMYDLGYLQELDHADLQTVFDNILPQFEKAAGDPDRKFMIPWQGGQTGIWVDTAKAPEIDSISDLFDPKYKGQVILLDEMRDTVPLVMQSEGIDVDTATKEDWLAAVDKIDKAVDSGQIRKITDNSYTEDLTAGNAVASIGWSGDGSLIGRDSVEWRRPKDGCDTFFDQMVIPVGAPNTAAALAFMNFVYRPEVQVDITQYVNYVQPVAGVQELLKKRDPELGNSNLIFPTPEDTAGCTEDPDPPGDFEDVRDVEGAYQDVISG